MRASSSPAPPAPPRSLARRAVLRPPRLGQLAQSLARPFAALLCVASCGAAARDRTVTLEDPALGMKAGELEIPAAWKFAGTVARPGGCNSSGASIKYTAQSPDGLTALEVLPGFRWSWSSDPSFAPFMEKQGCAIRDFTSAEEFLKQIALPALRPGAKVLSFEGPSAKWQAKLDELKKQMDAQSAQIARGYGQAPAKNVISSAGAHLESMRDGKPVDELISTTATCTSMTGPGVGLRAKPVEHRNCSVTAVVVKRAPRGTLAGEREQLEAIGGSFKMDQAWNQRIIANIQAQGQALQQAQRAQGQALLKQGEDAQAARNAQHQAWMEQQQRSFDSAQANDRARQAAIDHSAQQTAQHSLNQGTYVDPNSGQKTVTSDQYNHVWQAKDGTTLHTDDHNFDPNQHSNETWTELQPEK